MSRKKGFFLKHAKSSAFLVSIAVHAVLIVVALSFVAITVIKKVDPGFEVKEVKRPNMRLKHLQVPVNVKKMSQAPKLRKQIVATPKLNKVMPDIKMPEIVGVKGGLGNSGSGALSGAANLGFSMPELNFFGVKGKSEKIMLILNGDEEMSADSLGGAYGFEIIKNECLKLIEGLPSTALFNMIVYADGRTFELYPDMSPATPDNVQKAKDWLLPLNQVKGAQTKYGSRTLGPGGSRVEKSYPFGRFKESLFTPRGWNEPVFEAMRQQADTVFLLTHSWGSFMYQDRDAMNAVRKKWNETSAGKRWAKAVEDGRKLLDEDNAKRKANGEPPRALNRGSERAVVRAYKKQMGCEDIQEPPNAETTTLGVKDFVDAFEEAYKTYAREAPTLGIQKKHKPRFSLNVIYFKQEKFKDEKSQRYSDLHESEFTELARAFDGECRSVAGLAAIKSYVDASSLQE